MTDRLFKHQQDALPWARQNAYNVALFWEPRCGKTRGTLEIFKEARAAYPGLKLLVLSPLGLITDVWQRNVARFTDLSFDPFKKLRNIDDLPDVTALNFESVISAKQLPLLRQMIACRPFMCVIDESTKIAEPSSQTTKTIHSLVPFLRARMILTGSEVRNSELDYWGQISFIQPGLLPKSFYQFRNMYFYLSKETREGDVSLPQMPTPMTWDYLRDVIEKSDADFNLVRRAKALLMQYSRAATVPFPVAKEILGLIFQAGYRYVMRADKREQLINLIAPYCMWVKKKDCFDLPPTADQEREVFLTEAESRAYTDMETDLVAEIGGELAVAPVALAKIMKCRQATSGFIYDQQDRALVAGHSKISELDQVLEELGKQQVVIYAEFRHEFEQILELIRKHYPGRQAVTLYGLTKDKDDSIAQFEAGKAQYMIAHPQSAAHGRDFQFCSTMVFFSWSYSQELMQQARERLLGPLQDCNALYIYLVAKLKNGRQTIDQDMLDVVQGKATIQEMVYRIVQRNTGSHHARNQHQRRRAPDAQERVPEHLRLQAG